MTQCWYSYEVRKWKIRGAALLIPAGDAAIWLRTVALSEQEEKRDLEVGLGRWWWLSCVPEYL